MSSRRSKSTLRCKHSVVYEDVPPVKGDVVWCAMCGNYSEVLDVEFTGTDLPAWRWECRHRRHRDPIVKRFLGKKLECELSAIRHSKRNRHVVIMYAPSGDVHHTYAGHDPNQLSLPVVSDGTSDQLPF